MTFSRVGSSNKADKDDLAWLEELAAKGEISDDEFQEALADLENNLSPKPLQSREGRNMEWKKTKAVSGLEEGVGGFRRSND